MAKNKFVQEFKAFATRGNVMDMTVGIIVGGAFGKIVTSLVNDILMPPLGVILGGVDFRDLKYVIKEATADVQAVSINYGLFVQTVIDFLIVAFCIFMLIKMLSTLRRKEESRPEAPKLPSAEEALLTEIRDLLKKNS